MRTPSDAYVKLVDRNEEAKLADFIRPLGHPALWTALCHAQRAPFAPDDVESFGFNQPGVRRSAWAFLLAVVQNCRSTSGERSSLPNSASLLTDCSQFGFLFLALRDLFFLDKDHIQSLLPTLSTAALRSAWVESDPGVRGSTMWQSLMTFLNGWSIGSMYPQNAI